MSCEQLLPSIKHDYESLDNIIFTVITLQLCSVAVGSLSGPADLYDVIKADVPLLLLPLLMTVVLC